MPPLPCPSMAAPGAATDKVLSKSLSPSKISNNSTLEEINVILFHELLSQPVTSRASCHFWGFITVLWYCWYSFAFTTTPQPISQPFTHHLSKWQLQSPAPSPPPTAHGLPHPYHFNQSTNTRSQFQWDSHPPAAAEEPEIQEFLLYFQAYMCLKTGLFLSEGQAPGPRVVETAVPQILLRQGTNPSFSLQQWLLPPAQPQVAQTNPVGAWIAGSL